MSECPLHVAYTPVIPAVRKERRVDTDRDARAREQEIREAEIERNVKVYRVIETEVTDDDYLVVRLGARICW